MTKKPKQDQFTGLQIPKATTSKKRAILEISQYLISNYTTEP
jgi:hypothetical protein